MHRANARRPGKAVLKIMRLFAVLTLVVPGGAVLVFWRRDPRKRFTSS